MTGKIVGILVADNTSNYTNSILVQGILTNGNQQGNVSVKITNETQILRKDGNKLNNGTFANLKPGQSVDITFIGPIIQEYPPQRTGSINNHNKLSDNFYNNSFKLLYNFNFKMVSSCHLPLIYTK